VEERPIETKSTESLLSSFPQSKNIYIRVYTSNVIYHGDSEFRTKDVMH